jgi:hypothetical protein
MKSKSESSDTSEESYDGRFVERNISSLIKALSDYYDCVRISCHEYLVLVV